MRPVVIDASVALKWVAPHEAGHQQAITIQQDAAASRLELLAPTILGLEMLNVTGRRWRWDAADVEDLGAEIADLGISWSEPDLFRVGGWVGRGLTAYDAAYVVVAEQHDTQLVTADQQILGLFDRAIALTDWR